MSELYVAPGEWNEAHDSVSVHGVFVGPGNYLLHAVFSDEDPVCFTEYTPFPDARECRD